MNTVVFFFAFACAFLLGGRRPLLALSTRGLLVAVIGLAGSYLLMTGEPLHSILGAATLIANGLFLTFGTIDFLRYRAERSQS